MRAALASWTHRSALPMLCLTGRYDASTPSLDSLYPKMYHLRPNDFSMCAGRQYSGMKFLRSDGVKPSGAVSSFTRRVFSDMCSTLLIMRVNDDCHAPLP